MNNLAVTGKQNFMGVKIPVVLGGFGSGKKCISDKTIAEIHEMQAKHVRERITQNIGRFKENVDFIDLKQRVGLAGTLELLRNLGYAKQAITQAEHIYILSERGYAKLIKIMDTDLAWEIHDRLMDEYFTMREGKAKQAANALPSINNAVRFLSSLYKEAGADPAYIAKAASRVYKDQTKIDFDVPLASEPEALYDKTAIAEKLGMYSTNGNPHAQAVGALLSHLDIPESETIRTVYSRNGHEGVTIQYKPCVVDMAQKWLDETGYPTKIDSPNGNSFKIVYK